MGVEHTGVVTGTGRFRLRPDGRGGTTFSWDEVLALPVVARRAAGELIGGRVLGTVWRRNLRSLKGLVEGGGG